MSNKQHIKYQAIMFQNLVRRENYMAARELGFFKDSETLAKYDFIDEQITNKEIEQIQKLNRENKL